MDFMRRFEGAASQKLIHRLAWITVAFTYFLVALGATVRVNNAGLSCPDWPLCYGRIFSMESIGVLLEESHRYVASIVSILVMALVLSILLWARHDKRLLIPAIIAPCLLVVQIILGGLTVLMKLEGAIITLHLATAEALFATILFITIMAGNKVPNQEPAEKTHQFARLAVLNALLIYLLLLSGSYVFNTGASLACQGWPLCGDAPDWAVRYHLDNINMLHRYIAAIIGLVIIWTLLAAWRRRNVAPGQARMAIAAGILFIIQSGVGALVVLWNRPIDLISILADLHLAIATAVWACMVLLATMAVRQSLITSQVVIAESEPINEYHAASY